MKKSKNEMETNIKFFPDEKIDINKILDKIIKFGKIYKDNELNEIDEHKIMIKSFDKEEKNHIFLELNKISYEKYNQYFSKEIKYEEDETVFTIFLEGKDSNSLNSMYEIFDKSNLNKLSDKINFSMRKENNKLLLDFKMKFKEMLYGVKILHNLIFDINEISLILKVNLDLNKVLKMNGFDFFVSLFSIMLSAKFKGLKKILKNILEEKKKIKQQIDDYKKRNENNINREELLENEVEEDMKKDNELFGVGDIRFLENLIAIIDLIFTLNKLKINFLPEEPLKFFIEINNSTKESLNNGLKNIINTAKKIVRLLTETFKDIFKYIKLDNCLITILYMKPKISFALDINAIGLTNFANEVIEIVKEEKEKKEELKYIETKTIY